MNYGSARGTACMNTLRKPYRSDGSDEEWALLTPYLTLMRQDAPQRQHAMRKAFNGLRYLARSGCPWRTPPNDLCRSGTQSTSRLSAGSEPASSTTSPTISAVCCA